MGKFPTLFEQFNNLREAFHHNFTYLVSKEYRQEQDLMVSKEVFQERLTICKGCDRFDKDQTRCMECGCFLMIKARLTPEFCPLGKWKDETSNKR